MSTAPDAAIRFVFASELASFLAAQPGRACERTILVNAERFEVLELLEAHDLGGAIECEEHDSWTSDSARMFVRKDAVDLATGTVIGGSGRESEHFVLWTLPDRATRTCKLADLVLDYVASLRYFATRFDELVITADQARAHELPGVGMRMIVGQVGMEPMTFPRPGWYLQFESPPGGLQVFDVRVGREVAPEAIVSESFVGDPDKTLRFAGTEQVRFVGALRAAARCETGGDDPFMRMGWCLIPIAHTSGQLVIRIATRLPVGESPSWDRLMGFRGHQILADSFTLLEA